VLSAALSASAVAQTKSLYPSVASIAGKTGGEITIDAIVNSNKIETSHQGHHISEFKLTISSSGSVQSQFEATGNQLDNAMIGTLKTMRAGAHFYFEYMRCSDKDGHSHRVAALNFVLK
jgi:hypothetical protein